MTGLLCRAGRTVEFYVWKGCRRLAGARTHPPLWATCEMHACLCALYSTFKLLCKHLELFVLNTSLSVDLYP